MAQRSMLKYCQNVGPFKTYIKLTSPNYHRRKAFYIIYVCVWMDVHVLWVFLSSDCVYCFLLGVIGWPIRTFSNSAQIAFVWGEYCIFQEMDAWSMVLCCSYLFICPLDTGEYHNKHWTQFIIIFMFCNISLFPLYQRCLSPVYVSIAKQIITICFIFSDMFSSFCMASAWEDISKL